MKKIQFAMTCAVALISGASVADSQSNGVTPFDQLQLSAAANSFSAAVDGGSETTTGCTVSKDSEKVSVEGGYYVLDAELTDQGAPLVVSQSPQATNIVEKFDIRFKAAFVNEDDLTSALISGAKFGFALTCTNAASYYNGSQWATATNAADSVKLAVTEDADYQLHVDYDARELKARFTLSTTPVYTSQWMSVGKIESNVISVLGAGSVKSLAGATYSIAAEVIIVTPPGGSQTPMTFTEDQMKTLRAQVGGDDSAVASKLSSTEAQANGLQPMDNFILFGTVADSSITADTKPMAAGVPLPPSDENAGKVRVTLPNVTLQPVGGATVAFQLKGSEDNQNWENIGAATNAPTLEFPTDTPYRYFKVTTTITYGSVQQ